VELTPEHPVLVSRSISSSNGKMMAFTAPEWKEAKEVVVKHLPRDGDYLVMPILKGSVAVTDLDISCFATNRELAASKGRGTRLSLPLTTATAWFMGIYVAQGRTLLSKGEVILSFNHDEIEYQEQVLFLARSLGYSPRRVREVTSTKCVFSSLLLARAFREWFGEGAKNKKIPDFIMLHKNDEILRAFIKGWEDGGGHWYSKKSAKPMKHLAGATISKTLGLQLQLLYASLGIGANLIRIPKYGKSKISGRNLFASDLYVIDHSLTGSRQCFTKRSENFFFHPVRKVERTEYEGPVHNLETTDNSYLVSNAIVHNCMKEALRLLENGSNVPHYGRFLMATYLLAVGKTVEEIMSIFPKSPDFKKSVTQYQIEHIAGMKGGHTKYTVPSCRTLQTHSFCFKDPVKCYEISSPLQYPSKKSPQTDTSKTGKRPPEKEKRRGWTKPRR
jgi:hypothetical protein